MKILLRKIKERVVFWGEFFLHPIFHFISELMNSLFLLCFFLIFEVQK